MHQTFAVQILCRRTDAQCNLTSRADCIQHSRGTMPWQCVSCYCSKVWRVRRSLRVLEELQYHATRILLEVRTPIAKAIWGKRSKFMNSCEFLWVLHISKHFKPPRFGVLEGAQDLHQRFMPGLWGNPVGRPLRQRRAVGEGLGIPQLHGHRPGHGFPETPWPPRWKWKMMEKDGISLAIICQSILQRVTKIWRCPRTIK